MSDDAKRMKDALKASLNELRQPHPLEVLGFTVDLVRELDPEALSIAARGLARAKQLAMHPDRAPRQSKNLTARLQAVRAAAKAVDEDPHQARESYLALERTKRKQKIDPEAARNLVISRMIERMEAKRILAVRNFLEALYSPDAIIKIKSGNLLLQPVSIFPYQHGHLPSNGLRCEDGEVFAQRYVFMESIEDAERVRPVVEWLQLPPGPLYGLHATERTVTVMPEGGAAPSVIPNDGGVLDPGWYKLRGTVSDEKGDLRSLQVYQPLPPEEPVRLLGCISAATAKLIQEQALTARSSGKWNELQAVKSSPEYDVASKFHHNFIVSGRAWDDLLSCSPVYEPDYLTPKLVPGQVLIAEHSDGTRTMLGSIQHQAVEYY